MEAELAGPVEDVVERAGAGCAGGGRISARNTCSADGRVADSVLCKQREQSQVKASKGEQRRAKASKCEQRRAKASKGEQRQASKVGTL